jgi:hypothetical protein
MGLGVGIVDAVVVVDIGEMRIAEEEVGIGVDGADAVVGGVECGY